MKETQKQRHKQTKKQVDDERMAEIRKTKTNKETLTKKVINQ